MEGPDRGITKVVEAGGVPVTRGLFSNDPFPNNQCDFKDPGCLVGPGCMRTGTIYQISCNPCDPKPDGPRRRPTAGAGVVAGSRRRSRYIGQSGTTMHRRMLSHRAEITSKAATPSILKNTRLNHMRSRISQTSGWNSVGDQGQWCKDW